MSDYYCSLSLSDPTYNDVKRRHDAAELKGARTYEEGRWRVLTVTALRNMQECCGGVCRHCPYREANRRIDEMDNQSTAG